MPNARVLVLDDSKQVHDRIRQAFAGVPVTTKMLTGATDLSPARLDCLRDEHGWRGK